MKRIALLLALTCATGCTTAVDSPLILRHGFGLGFIELHAKVTDYCSVCIGYGGGVVNPISRPDSQAYNDDGVVHIGVPFSWFMRPPSNTFWQTLLGFHHTRFDREEDPTGRWVSSFLCVERPHFLKNRKDRYTW